MRTTMLTVVAALAAVALPGCLVGGGRSGGEVSVGASIEVEHDYIYYPSQHAYYCGTCDEWWVIESGGWVRYRSRPQGIVITAETPWVKVDVRGPLPQVRYEEHARDYPADWRSSEPKGPPPGRGWRK